MSIREMISPAIITDIEVVLAHIFIYVIQKRQNIILVIPLNNIACKFDYFL